jgi:Na+/proline symporter
MMGPMSDHKLLRTMRIVTLSFTILVTLYAINSKASIFKMVENAYQITLVMAFVPLAFGVYWKRATNQGALLAIFLGLSTWLSMLFAGPEDPFIPAQFAGLLMSLLGMVAGSLLPQWVAPPLPEHDLHAALHHRAAAHTQHVGPPPHHHS